MKPVIVLGAFDDVKSPQLRFLEEASRLGPVHAALWPDRLVQAQTGKPPKFPEAERLYFLQAVRHVAKAELAPDQGNPDSPPSALAIAAGAWVMEEGQENQTRRDWCAAHGLECRTIPAADLGRFPDPPAAIAPAAPGRKRAVVTGCYDWFHSGHVRFFEEAAEHADVYVVVGSDANVRLLKGEGHPMFPEAERRYVAGAIRYVRQALVSTGSGWMDAAPEIEAIRPDLYIVNEDGDKPEKRDFCATHGLEYRVLKRLPKPGLPRRQSTDLRGF